MSDPVAADEIERTRQAMEAAAASLDFEEAKRQRDRLNLLRGGATIEEADAADTRGLIRQQPGKMGIGTSRQQVTPPEGWTPPPRPDPLVKSRSRRR